VTTRARLWIGCALVCLTLAGLIPAACAAEADLDAWLTELKMEARQQGIASDTLASAFKDFKPIPEVIELDRRQLEFTLTLDQYLDRVVSADRVAAGEACMEEYQELLDKVYAQYGVQPRFLVALWGIETHYGQVTGSYPVIAAIATLAFDGRRSTFFRKELVHALRILDQGHIPLEEMTGSWAGAMGQFQFMPSSFARFAVDFDGDGRKDIWRNLADAFASAANYLVKSGWAKDQGWGEEVRLPPALDRDLIDLGVHKTVNSWEGLGVRGVNGRGMAEAPDLQASLVSPERPEGSAFMVFNNFRTLLRWNRSHFFAIAVGILADRLLGLGPGP
jgi:membrane-bound lytic murein transglycosylase B